MRKPCEQIASLIEHSVYLLGILGNQEEEILVAALNSFWLNAHQQQFLGFAHVLLMHVMHPIALCRRRLEYTKLSQQIVAWKQKQIISSCHDKFGYGNNNDDHLWWCYPS